MGPKSRQDVTGFVRGLLAGILFKGTMGAVVAAFFVVLHLRLPGLAFQVLRGFVHELEPCGLGLGWKAIGLSPCQSGDEGACRI